MFSSSTSPSDELYGDKPRFPGALDCHFVQDLKFIDPDDGDPIPVYRVMDRQGKIIQESDDPKVLINARAKMWILHNNNNKKNFIKVSVF